MSRTQRLVVALGLLISVVFLWLAFRQLNPEAIFTEIRQANPIPILVGSVVFFAAVAMISYRWSFLTRSVRRIPLRDLISLVCIGYMGNNVYPFRSGELLRIWLAQRNHHAPMARTATTIAVERVFDGIVMLTFIFVAILALGVASDTIHQVAIYSAPVFIAGLVVFFILAARPNLLRWLIERVARVLPARFGQIIQHLGEEVIAGLECLRSPTDLIGLTITSYLSWMMKAVVYYIVAFAFDMNVSYLDMLLVVGVVNLAGLIPASPGQLGMFEFFVSTVLIAVGVREAIATAYALVIHLVIWLPVTLVGFVLLARQGLNLQAVRQAHTISEAAGD